MLFGKAYLVAQLVNNGTCNSEDPGSIPGLGRSAGEGIGYPLQYSWASLVAQMVRNLPAMQETWVWSMGWEDPLEEDMATHSSILAWWIPWTEEPGGLQSMGSQRVGHNWATQHEEERRDGGEGSTLRTQTENTWFGASLPIQWLRLHGSSKGSFRGPVPFHCRGTGSTLSQGTKMLHAEWRGQKILKNCFKNVQGRRVSSLLTFYLWSSKSPSLAWFVMSSVLLYFNRAALLCIEMFIL